MIKNKNCKIASFGNDLGKFICKISGSEYIYLILNSYQCAQDGYIDIKGESKYG